MLKKSPFFDFLNRREGTDFQKYLADSVQDSDYIEWNGFLLPNDYGDAGTEYRAIRRGCEQTLKPQSGKCFNPGYC